MQILYSIRIVRMIIGGKWYLIHDYNQHQDYWVRDYPQGYQILESEVW